MRKSVYNLLREAQQKMSGFAVFMNYRFMLFGVKAEPAALLSVEIMKGGEPADLEDVADVAIPRDDQFALIPKEQEDLFAICKAVATAHPDYKIEQKSMNGENGYQEEAESDVEDDKYVLCTMPDVDDERHDAGMDYVKAVHEEMTGRIEAANAAYDAKMAMLLTDAKPEEIDEAKGELKKLHGQIMDICNSYRENKEKQIETAHQAYLTKKAEDEKKARESEEARGEDMGARLDFNKLKIFGN